MHSRDDLMIGMLEAARAGEPLPILPPPSEARAIRQGAGVKLPELAVALGGLSTSTVLRFERGQSTPSGRTDLKWRRVLRFLADLAA